MVETVVSLLDNVTDNRVIHKLDSVRNEVQSKLHSLWKNSKKWQNRKLFLYCFLRKALLHPKALSLWKSFEKWQNRKLV